jgi:hypothetical protein
MRCHSTAVLAVSVLALSCAQDPEDSATDEEEILQLIAQSSESSMGSLDGQGLSGGSKDSVYPEGWWRTLSSDGAWELVFENDPATGICTVTVNRSLNGVLNIDVVHDGERDPGATPFTHLRQRRVIVARQGESGDPYSGWVLTHITPAVYSLGSSIPQEVFVASMAVYAGDDMLWECTDPETFYPVDGGLPVLEPGTLIRLEAEVIHTNPVYTPPLVVYAHGPCPVWPRHWMNDAGLYGDRAAGDGIYSYEWYAEESSEHWYIAVDVLDSDTMIDQDEDDYDAGAWGIFALKE